MMFQPNFPDIPRPWPDNDDDGDDEDGMGWCGF